MDKKLNCNAGCRFCKIFNQKSESEKIIDKPIARADNFIALVSKGAIVEGWVLIIPKIHTYSMRNLYCDDEFVCFTNNILSKIKQKYKRDCLVFEHGANRCDSLTSCGTNHAHLHIVPYDKSLLNEMRKNDLEWKQCRSSEIKGLVGNGEYWFYAEKVKDIQDVKGYLHIIEQPESQYFRKIIAEKEKCVEKFNYKEFQFIENEKSTYEALMG